MSLVLGVDIAEDELVNVFFDHKVALVKFHANKKNNFDDCDVYLISN